MQGMNGQTAVIKSIRRNKPIDCGAVLLEQVPRLSAYPALIRQLTVFALQKLVCEDRINAFLIDNAMIRDFAFVDQVFQHLKIDFELSAKTSRISRQKAG